MTPEHIFFFLLAKETSGVTLLNSMEPGLLKETENSWAGTGRA